jgi:hypothetical protein
MIFPQLGASGCSANPLDDSGGSEEQDEQSRPARHLLVLVRHDIRQLRKHFDRHREGMQQRLSHPRGHTGRKEGLHRVRIQLAAEGIVVRDQLGKSRDTHSAVRRYR